MENASMNVENRVSSAPQAEGNLPEGGQPPIQGDVEQVSEAAPTAPERSEARASETLVRMLEAPATGGTVAGLAVLGAAVLWGPLEAALGVGAAYGAYRLARKRRSRSAHSGSASVASA